MREKGASATPPATRPNWATLAAGFVAVVHSAPLLGKLRTLGAVVLAVAVFGGCAETKAKTDTVDAACTPGRSIACTGVDNCAGRQICDKGGASYGVCICAGDETFASAGPASGLLGATCRDASDCRASYSCLDSASDDVEGEGPSAGLCVLECARDASICERADASTTCVVLDDRGTSDSLDDAAYCLPTCTLGDPDPDDDKCRGRIDMVCNEQTAGTGVGFCRPACRSDLDCGDRHCNLRTGLCADQPPEGAGIGSACDPTAPECAGGCIEHGSSYAECSGVCRLGTPGCGQSTADGPPFNYYCYLDPSRMGGVGDLGYCTKLCDCDDDCARADTVCEADDSLSEATGRKGVCASKVFGSGAARPHVPCN